MPSHFGDVNSGANRMGSKDLVIVVNVVSTLNSHLRRKKIARSKQCILLLHFILLPHSGGKF